MRHFRFGSRRRGQAPAVARLPTRVLVPTPPARLVTPTGRARVFAAAPLRAHPAAVPLAAVAHRADRHQPPTARARIESVVRTHQPPSGCRGAGRCSELRRYWTQERGGNAVLPRRGPGGLTAKSQHPPGPSPSSATTPPSSETTSRLSPGWRNAGRPPRRRPPTPGGDDADGASPPLMAENFHLHRIAAGLLSRQHLESRRRFPPNRRRRRAPCERHRRATRRDRSCRRRAGRGRAGAARA